MTANAWDCWVIDVSLRSTTYFGERRPVLVVGSSGQLAFHMKHIKSICGHPLLSIGRPRLDLTDQASVETCLAQSAPCAVVNAGAYTNVDAAEAQPELAFSVNQEGAANLADLCQSHGLPLVHVSTDYVFDGAYRRPYLENDPVSPIGAYAESKAAGEEAVRARCEQHLILRTSWVYGNHGHNFYQTMLEMAKQRDTLRVVDDQHGTPTWVQELAKAISALIVQIVQSDKPMQWGTYHVCNAGQTTWFGFADEIFSLAACYGLPAPRLIAIPTQEFLRPAARPPYSVLNNERLANVFGIRLPSWKASLSDCFNERLRATSAERVET